MIIIIYKKANVYGSASQAMLIPKQFHKPVQIPQLCFGNSTGFFIYQANVKQPKLLVQAVSENLKAIKIWMWNKSNSKENCFLPI